MKTLLTLSATSLVLAASAATQRPNILLVTCEDINPYLGCYGDKVAVSPNIDRFASEGVMFTDMHTTIGVSAPSRFAIITGMYPSSLGGNYMRNFINIKKKPEQYPEGLTPYQVILPEEVKAFPEYLREVGYYCINNGKSDYQFNAAMSTWNEGGKDASWKNCPKDIERLKVELNRWLEVYNPDWSLTEQQRRDKILPNNGKQPVLAEPTITKSGKSLVIASDNGGASIVYKINGLGDTERSWSLYTSKIEGLKSGDVITAVATRAGYKSSKMAEFTY